MSAIVLFQLLPFSPFSEGGFRGVAEVTSRQGERDVVVAKRLSLPSVDLAGSRAFNDDRLQFMWRFFSSGFQSTFFVGGGGGVVLTVAVHGTHPTRVVAQNYCFD